MKRATVFLPLLLASGLVQAHPHRHDVHVGCDVGSDYSVDLVRRAFLFTHTDGKDREIGIGGGRLFVDGREQTLSAADHQRLREMEVEMHHLVPEVRNLTTEAIEIAFTALREVARGLASDPASAVASLDSAHRRVRREMTARPLAFLDEDAVTDVIRPILTEYVPQIVSGAVSSALKAAFSGEAKQHEFEQRMQRMEQELESKVEARADALEPLAENMCLRLRKIDDLDDSLEYRLDNGDKLQLLRVRPDKRDDD